MSRLRGLVCAALLTVMARWCAPAAASDPAPPARIEARSPTLSAVGVVRGEHLSIRLIRPVDNSPVSDAVVKVHLRGSVHPALAEADGSYSLDAKDLAIPGSAAVEFEVSEAGASQTLAGTLERTDAPANPEGGNAARQYGWWVLNFAVCIGFLMLLSRRRKAAGPD